MATKVVATAIVKGVNRKLAASRAAITLVSFRQLFHIRKKDSEVYVTEGHPKKEKIPMIKIIISLLSKQTPAAVNRVKELLGNQADIVSIQL